MKRINVITAENWLEFFQDIKESELSDLSELSKTEIKQQLTDNAVLIIAEPMLSKERKAVITMYLETKSTIAFTNEDLIFSQFKKAVDEKNVTEARAIQKELMEQIIDNKAPVSFIDKFEVPASKDFSSLLNDREVYKYLLKATSEYEALDNFLLLSKLDPDNGRIIYNICALRFFMWQFGGDSTAQKLLLKDINRLPQLGISNLLVKRMLINYYIMSCEEDMRAFRYDQKDTTLQQIRNTYDSVTLNDDDVYSLAKYFASYARQDWSREIVTPRINKIDVNEDLVFYYLNLLFYFPSTYDSEEFKSALLNAINLNPQRFCNFFLPSDKGGASMQLLDYSILKERYCESCR